MSLKCLSRIARVYKTKKADVIWPEGVYGPMDPQELAKYPEVCGGDVTIALELRNEPYMGGTDAKLETTFVCSRCAVPYFSRRLEFENDPLGTITYLVNEQLPVWTTWEKA